MIGRGCTRKGVRLAGYVGDAADLPRDAFQEILDAVAAGQLTFPVDRVDDGLEQVPQAHDDMDHELALADVRHEHGAAATAPGPTEASAQRGGWSSRIVTEARRLAVVRRTRVFFYSFGHVIAH